MKQMLVDEELLGQVLEFVEYHDRYWSGNGEHPQTIVTSLRAALEQPAVEPVPMLMVDEIRKVSDKADEGQESTEFMLAFARAIEQDVRQKASIK